MTATFDEAVRHQSGLRLIADVLVSLVRQWGKTIDGSDQAYQPLYPGRSAALEAFRQRSIEAHSRAWRINFAVATGLIVIYAAAADWPLTISRAPWLFLAVTLGIALMLRQSPRWMDGPAQILSQMSLLENPRVTQLLVQRERLSKWSTSFILLLVIQNGALHALNLLQGYRLLEAEDRAIRLVCVITVWIVGLLIIPRALRKVNERASLALKEEIDAIRGQQV